MAGKGLRSLSEAMRGLTLSSQQTCKTLPSRILPLTTQRSMASIAPVANITRSVTDVFQPLSSVPVTVYSFPSLEPRTLESWSPKHLNLPLRRDILHLAVIYEGDKTRQGTASAKTRWEKAGSHRKMHRQKGTGAARRGSRQSPLMAGGGKSHGPKPRDFSTKLNRKVYDLAWRTALSYRYRRGELIVTEDGLELPLPVDFLQLAEAGLHQKLEDQFVQKYVRELLTELEWGRSFGRTTFITESNRPNLFTGLELAREEARAMKLADVDVKNLLETGRIVIERSALKSLIKDHQRDLVTSIGMNGLRKVGLPTGRKILTL